MTVTVVYNDGQYSDIEALEFDYGNGCFNIKTSERFIIIPFNNVFSVSQH